MIIISNTLTHLYEMTRLLNRIFVGTEIKTRCIFKYEGTPTYFRCSLTINPREEVYRVNIEDAISIITCYDKYSVVRFKAPEMSDLHKVIRELYSKDKLSTYAKELIEYTSLKERIPKITTEDIIEIVLNPDKAPTILQRLRYDIFDEIKKFMEVGKRYSYYYSKGAEGLEYEVAYPTITYRYHILGKGEVIRIEQDFREKEKVLITITEEGRVTFSEGVTTEVIDKYVKTNPDLAEVIKAFYHNELPYFESAVTTPVGLRLRLDFLVDGLYTLLGYLIRTALILYILSTEIRKEPKMFNLVKEALVRSLM